MRIEPPGKKHKPISLTPLVDVIFLLLLFFMLSSTFTNFGQVEIGAPASGGGTSSVPTAILVLDGELLRLNGTEIENDQMVERARILVDQKSHTLLVLTRKETTTQQLVTVLTRLKAVPGLKVTVAGGT
ncbi:MAG: biopolymer transporter ExbD [Roseibium sp.]